MILVCDSGTTKADWLCVSSSNRTDDISTEGINPVFQTPETVCAILENLSVRLSESPRKIFFYSAGVDASQASNNELKEIFGRIFPFSQTEIFNDKLCAARALCGNRSGIACIMGTGSNACFYDGEKIVDQQVGGGYVLGDEGGAVSLGRRLLADFIRGLLPENVSDELKKRFGLNYFKIVDAVYRTPMPNRFLASFSKFIFEFKNDPYIREIIVSNFRNFIQRNLQKWDTVQNPINSVGSVAHFYKSELEIAAADCGARLGKILRSPAAAIADYHKKDL